MVAHEDGAPSGESEDALVRFCCQFREYLTRLSGVKQTRAVCTESYREVAARHQPCARCRHEIEASQRRCGNPFARHQHRFRSRLQRVDGQIARRFPALAGCEYVCIYCLLTAKREQKKERSNWRAFAGSEDKIKEQLESLGLCRDDVRRGIVQIMKRPHVVLSRMQMNDHWKNNNNHFTIKDVTQAENYDSSDSNDQRSLCSYDADEEETNGCEDIILKGKQNEETYSSNSSLTVSRVESVPKNLSSDPSSSLRVNFNIEQNLFTSKVLKTKGSKFNKNIIKFKKRHSLPAIHTLQKNNSKLSLLHSNNLSTIADAGSSLKLILKKDRISQEYRISSSNVQLTEPKNLLKIVDDNSSDSSSSNFTNRPTSSEDQSLIGKDSDSIGNNSKLNIHVNKTVPELEINDTRPLSMPVNRINLENSLSSFLKSKLKRNLRDTVEVERKRQKVTDDSVAVNINVNITVNSLLEGTSHKPLELSSNDNSKVLLPKTSTDICSTSDFSSCNESDDESRIYPKLNSKINTSKNSYLKKCELERNTSSVNSTQDILQIDYNYNKVDRNHSEKEIPKTNETSLKKSDKEIKVSKIETKGKHQQNLSANEDLKLVFNNLFGEVSDASGTEEEIIRNRKRKSRENKVNQSTTNGIAELVEKNQSKNEKNVFFTADQDKPKLKDISRCSLDLTAIENIEEINYNKTEISNAELSDINKNSEIPSEDNNVQTTKLPDNQILITKQIEFEKNQNNKGTNSNIIDENNPRQVDKLNKSCDKEETNSYIRDENIPKKVDEFEIKCDSEKTNSYVENDFSTKDQLMPDCTPVYDQVNLEGGDFEFMSSINKNKRSNEYSDDEYNNYSDFDAEYDEAKNIECSSDIELIEFHKNPSSNLDLQDCKEVSAHNLNKLPSFYNEDVTNYVNKDIIDVDDDDDDVKILDDFRPVFNAENKKRNLNTLKFIKSEAVINLDSDGEFTDVEEIPIEEINDELPNKIINDSKENIINNIINNSNTEGASEIYQSTESNDNIDNNLEIQNVIEKTELCDQSLNISDFDFETITNEETVSSVTLTHPEDNGNAEDTSEIYQSPESNHNIDNNSEIQSVVIEKTELCDQSLNISDFDFEKLTNEEAVSSMTLTHPEESGNSAEVISNQNQIPVSSDNSFSYTLEESINSSQETVCSDDTFVIKLIEDALKPSSDLSEKSADLHRLNIGSSENILNSNSETAFSSTLIADYSEDTLDENRESVSPNALVIDETAGNDDSNISDHFTSEFDLSISNKMINSESLENNLNSCEISNSVNEDTSSADDLRSKHIIRNFKNVDHDLNNPNILKEFNLSKESIAPEEIKSEPFISDENNIEQETCKNLLEELKKNACRYQEQSNVKISVSETSNSISKPAITNEKLENPENLNEISDWIDIDNLNKKEVVATGSFKCRDINELLANPVNKKTEANICHAEALNLNEQTSALSQSSTANSSNSIKNGVHIQNNNSTCQINSQNNLVQSNIYLPKPNNQLQSMAIQMPSSQGYIPQQMHQPVLNTTVNATMKPQYTPQLVIPNSIQNSQNLSQQTFTSVISNVQNQQILLQGNPQNSTSVNSNNIQNQNYPLRNLENFTYVFHNNGHNQNLSQRNLQNFTSSISNSGLNQNISQENTSLIFASSMFTKEFAHNNTIPTNLSEPQMSSIAIPNVQDTIFSLPLAPSKDLILPEPLSIISGENQSSIFDKVYRFRRIVLQKIETELESLRALSDILICYDTLKQRKTLTENVWNFQKGILNIMKCFHAICTTTTKKDDLTIFFAVNNSVKQIEGNLKFKHILDVNKSLKECGYQLKDTKGGINPVPLELEALADQNKLVQSTNSMSIKQKNQFYSQIKTYHKLLKTHKMQVCSQNVENQNVTQNCSMTNKSTNVATISNTSTNHNSLQKSSLNDIKKKQSILSTNNVTVQKSIDKANLNKTKISRIGVGSEKKDSNTESILDNLNNTCLKCEKASEITCSNCLSVGYCSRECQYNHWNEVHYKTCENTSS